MHVAFAPGSQVINELTDNTCQPCGLDGGMDCTLESRWPISEAESKSVPHVKGFGSADACEGNALGIHRDLPESAG